MACCIKYLYGFTDIDNISKDAEVTASFNMIA